MAKRSIERTNARARPLIVCVQGSQKAGKTTIIREATERFFQLRRTSRGEVIGIFQRRTRKRPNYAVGVTSAGDSPTMIDAGFDFLCRYRGLPVIICAAHNPGTITANHIETWRQRLGAQIQFVSVQPQTTPAQWRTQLNGAVARIRQLLP